MDQELESKVAKSEGDGRNAAVPTFGPRRLRNKTKAERSGPRKRRRKKKKKNAQKVLDGSSATHLSGHAKGSDMRSFDVKKQIAHETEEKIMQKNSFHGPDFRELGGDESVRRTKSDDTFTLYSFYSQLVAPPSPKHSHNSAYFGTDDNKIHKTRKTLSPNEIREDIDGQLGIEPNALNSDSSLGNIATFASPSSGNSSWVFSPNSVDAQNGDNRSGDIVVVAAVELNASVE